MSDTITLISYNTWKCEGDYLARLALMRRELAALTPDLLLLQEVYAEVDGVSTGDVLADALELRCHFSRARFKLRERDGRLRQSWSGMAILSRLPVLDMETVSLPSDPRDGERIAQLAELEVDGGRLLIANLHLTHIRDATPIRIAQLSTLLQHPWLDRNHAAVVFCGDFNEPPGQGALAWLARHPQWRITDLQQAFNPGGKRTSTLTQSAQGLVPGPNLDYCLLLECQHPSSLRLLSADYVLNQPDPESGIYPSDHFGIRIAFGVGA